MPTASLLVLVPSLSPASRLYRILLLLKDPAPSSLSLFEEPLLVVVYTIVSKPSSALLFSDYATGHRVSGR